MDDSSVIKVHVDEYETDSDDEEDVDNNDESEDLSNQLLWKDPGNVFAVLYVLCEISLKKHISSYSKEGKL